MPEVGDVATVTLLVDPFDQTTVATVTARRPDGTTEAPAATTSDGGNTWRAAVEYDQAGVWTFTWSVTGTGARAARERVSVAPSPDDVPTGRVYANSADLAKFLGEAPPLDADQRLRDASAVIDTALLTSVYAVDATGYPTDPEQREAVRVATCAVAEWWIETGDDSLGASYWESASAGGVSVSRGGDADTRISPGRLPAKAWSALVRAGLLGGVVRQE